jgi:hypothetical protein
MQQIEAGRHIGVVKDDVNAQETSIFLQVSTSIPPTIQINISFRKLHCEGETSALEEVFK